MAYGRRRTWRQKEVFEEERRKIAPTVQACFAVHSERLLPDRPFARLSELGDVAVAETFELQQSNLPFRRAEPPPIELAIDRCAESLKDGLSFAVPSPRVFAPSPGFVPGRYQLPVERLRPAPLGYHLPPVNRDSGQRRREDEKLEGLERDRLPAHELDRQVDRHQHRNHDKQEDRHPYSVADAGRVAPEPHKLGRPVMRDAPLLRMSGIRKTFPGVVALDDVSFDLRLGEVHVLVGENGAGKSTLMKILSGACRRDAGDIEIGGCPAANGSPRDAQALGVATIYQELSLVPQLTVAENILLGHEPSRAGWIDRAGLADRATQSLAEAGVTLHSARRVDSLGIAEQQMVEVAKALFRRARVLVMDEPTSALTAREIDHLFSVIRRLTAKGAGVIYISHRLSELPAIGQRVTVLRDGRNVGTFDLSTVSIAELVRLMANRDVRDHFPRRRPTPPSVAAPPAPPDPPVPLLQLEHLSGDSGVDDVSLTVHRGEIVGLAGLLGAGRTELARLIVGADVVSSGRVAVNGRDVTPRSPRDAIRAGIGFLPEDRKRQGLVMPHSVSRNVALPNLARWSTAGWVSARAERTAAERWVTELRIKTPSVDERVARLSGGTQQRIVLARWLAAECQLLVMDEPTRGVDVAARAEIYELMNQVTEAGVGILMISSDLPEVLGMSDRIYVMRGGRIELELDAQAATDELVLQAALGLA